MKTQSKIFSLVPSLIFAFLFIVISKTQADFITNSKTKTCLQYSVNLTQDCMPLTFTNCQFGNSSSDSTKWNLISLNPSRPISEIFIESFDNKLCLTTKSDSGVEACPCINDVVNQKWKVNVDGSFSSSSNDGKCLTVSDDDVVGLDTCQGKSTLMTWKTSDVAPNKSETDTDDDDDDDDHDHKGLKPWHIILIVILILLILLIIIIVAALLIRRSNIKKRQTKIDNFKEAYDENKVQKQMRNLYDIAPRLVKNNDYKISPLKKLEPAYSSKQAQLNRIHSNYSNNDSDNDNDDNEKNGAFFKRQKLRRSSTMGSVNRKARCYFENNNYDDFEIIVADKAIKTSPHTIFNEDYHTGGNDLS